jgi:hypothetical protein
VVLQTAINMQVTLRKRLRKLYVQMKYDGLILLVLKFMPKYLPFLGGIYGLFK